MITDQFADSIRIAAPTMKETMTRALAVYQVQHQGSSVDQTPEQQVAALSKQLVPMVEFLLYQMARNVTPEVKLAYYTTEFHQHNEAAARWATMMHAARRGEA